MTRISVIVCSRNRAGSLIECLNSMAEAVAEIKPQVAEIIVVDNASTDDTAARVKEWIARYDGEAHYLLEPRKGVSYAKNTAMAAAKGDLFILTDDDCRFDRQHISDALRYAAGDTAPVLRGGRVALGDKNDLPLTIKEDTKAEKWHRSLRSERYCDIGNTIVGCNMMIPRAIYETIGGYDVDLGPGKTIPAAEDTDYIFRAYLADFYIEYVPDMKVLHFHGRKQVEEGRKLAKQYGVGKGAIYIKYMFKAPQLCRQFYWDAKTVVHDLSRPEPIYMHPSIKFTHLSQVLCNLKGMGLYIALKLGFPV
jgi:GT2 family glycosyltransferase